MTNNPSSSHRAARVTPNAGSASHRRRPCTELCEPSLFKARPASWPQPPSRQDLGDPAVDNTLAVGSGISIVDGKDFRAPEHLGEAGLGLHVGVRRHEVDLVLGKQALHGGAGRPVDQLLARIGVLGTLDQGDSLGGRADTLLRETNDDIIALGLGVECIDDEEDAAGRLTQTDRQCATTAALGVELNVGAKLLEIAKCLLLVAAVDL